LLEFLEFLSAKYERNVDIMNFQESNLRLKIDQIMSMSNITKKHPVSLKYYDNSTL